MSHTVKEQEGNRACTLQTHSVRQSHSPSSTFTFPQDILTFLPDILACCSLLYYKFNSDTMDILLFPPHCLPEYVVQEYARADYELLPLISQGEWCRCCETRNIRD
jgi:hypothetical protein